MPQYSFNNYTEERQDKGRTPYYKMTVNYSAKGESKSKTVMSFSNPAVYNAIKGLKEGDLFDVEFVEGDKYYNWASVKPVSGTTASASTGEIKSAPAARSTYETPEERAKKQVYIIKQSCLAQAVAYSDSAQPSVDAVLDIAQQFVDWILEDETEGTAS